MQTWGRSKLEFLWLLWEREELATVAWYLAISFLGALDLSVYPQHIVTSLEAFPVILCADLCSRCCVSCRLPARHSAAVLVTSLSVFTGDRVICEDEASNEELPPSDLSGTLWGIVLINMEEGPDSESGGTLDRWSWVKQLSQPQRSNQ